MNLTKVKVDGMDGFVWRADDAGEVARHLRANLRKRTCHHSMDWSERDPWTGGESCEESIQYATTGNDALVPLAEEFLAKVNSGGIETVRHEWEPSVCGAYPVVADFLAGHPAPMRRRSEQRSERSPVRVIVDTTSSASISAHDLQRRGAAIVAFVMALMQERPVELWQMTTLDAGGHNFAALMVRCPTVPVNLGVVAHLLTSQTWTRGIGYGWLAQNHGSEGSWGWGLTPLTKDAKAQYTSRTREAIRAEPQDVYIPAIVLNDELVKDPVGWINRTLDHLRQHTEGL